MQLVAAPKQADPHAPPPRSTVRASPTWACTASPTSRPWSPPSPTDHLRPALLQVRLPDQGARPRRPAHQPGAARWQALQRGAYPRGHRPGRDLRQAGRGEEARRRLQRSIERAKKAYDGSSTVMAVDVSGGNIGYVAPGKGRTWGPVFDLLGLSRPSRSRARPTRTPVTTSPSRLLPRRTRRGSSSSTATPPSPRTVPTPRPRP